MKKSNFTFALGVTILFVWVLACLTLRGRQNYETARFNATYTDGTDYEIEQEMRKFGFCQDGDIFRGATTVEYFVSGLCY
jgi:hypothetical protein